MFSLKKKKTKGIQGGLAYPEPSEDLIEPMPMEFLEQHHKKTMNKSQNNILHNYLNLPTAHNPHIPTAHINAINQILPTTSSGFEYPHSGDESDNNHNQMEHLRSQFYTTDPEKRTKEYHMEQAVQAIELLKGITKPNGWKKVDKHKSGCIVYQSTGPSTIPTRGDIKYPAFKGEHVIGGYKAQDVFAIVGVRKLWDDWYDELSCIEKYDDATSLIYMVMKGTLSSKTRDVALVERIEHDKDGTIYYASCSVESNKIPRASGKVRAEISLAGWVIQPLPSNPPITKITYVIHTDLLSRLPKFIAKRSLAKRAMAIATIEAYLRKNGAPPAVAALKRAHSRPRSLSEPVKLDRFLMPAESDDEDDIPSGPSKSRQNLRYMSEGAESDEDEDDDDLDIIIPRHTKGLTSLTPPTMRSSLMSDNTLFSKESNSYIQDSSAFGDSSNVFGKTSYNEKPPKILEETPVAPPSRFLPSVVKQQVQKEHVKERSQEKLARPRHPSNASKTFVPEPETKKLQHNNNNNNSNKRISIPVVAPKSEARVKQHNGTGQNDSSNQLSIPESIALGTPDRPLTPPASIDGKDGSSDSDGAQIKLPEVVPRAPKPTPVPTEKETSESTSLAMSSLAMKAPSAMMEANTRRHSALFSRNGGFIPRHSHGVPIRGNPNVSLQSLIRPSGPNTSMSTSVKRHSMAPSIESNRSTTIFTPMMVLPHRHSETARKALAMFKVLASSPEDRWRAIASENGFKSYSRVISGAGLPMLRSEGTITGGWTVEQINAVIESSGCRQIWDERFENMSIAETFNHNEYLFHISLRGVGSMTGRDLAGVTIIDRDPQTSALYNVSTSVLDPTIPEDPGRIRAMLELSGWSLRPTFDGQGNTLSVNVTFVVQIDIRGNLPTAVVKSMTSSMSTAVSRLNQFINKSGYPPFASHISGTRLLDTFDPSNGFYELCYKAAPGWTEVRIGRKVYKEGYDFFIKPDDPSVKVEMAPDFGGVRVWTTLDHEGQSIIAQVSRKGQNVILPEPEPAQEQSDEVEAEEEKAVEQEVQSPSGRKRSSSLATPQRPFAANSRPDSQASIASKASQSSERSRRGRSTRPLVTLPAGTPPPPLPRRSSSLTRYSVPISEYLAGDDAPPVPFSATLANASESNLLSRPISESLGSPTLGFFHVPVVPVVSTAAAAASVASTAVVSSTEEDKPKDDIPTSPLSDEEPESTLTIVAAATAAAAAVTEEVDTVAVTTESQSLLDLPPSPHTPVLPIDKKTIEEVISSLSSQVSPSNTPVPSPMAMTFNPRSSSLPITEPIQLGSVGVKSVPPSAMINGATKKRDIRVTFSLDTIDKSSSEDGAPKVRSTKGHAVQIITPAQYDQQNAIVELGSDCESDEAEFVEARDELSEDELELAFILTTVGSWPSLMSASSTSNKQIEEKNRGVEMVSSTLKAVENGFRMVTTGSPTEVKVAIVFLLLVYYAGRLSSLIA
ncbi:hypothetical protein BGZ49_007183 [Haplosporangium sp. Z 27]|nr:hypothetical protein BGZ49_007183 [Haplosporangium sp. Z 27]